MRKLTIFLILSGLVLVACKKGGGADTVSVNAYDIRVSDKDLKEFKQRMPTNTMTPNRNQNVADPKGYTFLGFVPSNSTFCLRLEGQWHAGSFQPWVSPIGIKEDFNGSNRWASMIVVENTFAGTRWVFAYPGHESVINGYGRGWSEVYVIMNDDLFADNDNHPTDPMRYLLYPCNR